MNSHVIHTQLAIAAVRITMTFAVPREKCKRIVVRARGIVISSFHSTMKRDTSTKYLQNLQLGNLLSLHQFCMVKSERFDSA